MDIGIIGSIVIGIIAGFISSRSTKGRGFSVIVNLIVGLVGSILGGLIFSLQGLTFGGLIGVLIASVVGAVFCLWVLSLFSRREKQTGVYNR